MAASELVRSSCVLVADDSLGALEMVGAQLRHIFGGQQIPVQVLYVTDAENAEKALCLREFDAYSPASCRHRRQNACRVNAAFMDCEMPKRPHGPIEREAGIQVTAAVREEEERQHTPHVPIFAHSAAEDQAQFKKPALFDDVLPKGSPLKRIEAVLREAGLFD